MVKKLLVLVFLSAITTVQAADVSVYQHCGFKGYKIDLPKGNLDLNRLARLGMKNDDISSIRVKPGSKAVLYQHAGFKGASRTITGNISCLVDQQFNDVVSSIRVSGPKNHGASSVNGKNVGTAVFSGGRFVQTGPRKWTEYGQNGRANFTFDETGRDAWSVYMNDRSRNVQIQIDIHRKMIRYGENNGAKRDLYRIVSSSAKRQFSAPPPKRPVNGRPVNGRPVSRPVNFEQDCFNRVQGKVAYNRSGNKNWNPGNIKSLCKGTKNPARTVNCFKSGIRNHGEWQKATRDCQGGARVSNAPAPVKPVWLSHNVNGKNISAAYHDRGRFEETGKRTGIWKEYGKRGGANFTFREQRRDDWSVYLRDASRNMNIQIDVHRKMISFDNGGGKKDLYRTTHLSRIQ